MSDDAAEAPAPKPRARKKAKAKPDGERDYIALTKGDGEQQERVSFSLSPGVDGKHLVRTRKRGADKKFKTVIEPFEVPLGARERFDQLVKAAHEKGWSKESGKATAEDLL